MHISILLVCFFLRGIIAQTYFYEPFEEDSLGKQWIITNNEKFNGTWTIENMNDDVFSEFGTISKGLTTKTENSYSAISKRANFFIKGLPLIIQYQLKAQNIPFLCGGAYIKLLAEDYLQGEFDSNTGYHIMFGPDSCSGSSKIHFILRLFHLNTSAQTEQQNKYFYTEHQLISSPPALLWEDQLSHIFTLVIRKNTDNITDEEDHSQVIKDTNKRLNKKPYLEFIILMDGEVLKRGRMINLPETNDDNKKQRKNLKGENGNGHHHKHENGQISEEQKIKNEQMMKQLMDLYSSFGGSDIMGNIGGDNLNKGNGNGMNNIGSQFPQIPQFGFNQLSSPYKSEFNPPIQPQLLIEDTESDEIDQISEQNEYEVSNERKETEIKIDIDQQTTQSLNEDENYDENEPEFIFDPNDKKPDDWDDNAPKLIMIEVEVEEEINQENIDEDNKEIINQLNNKNQNKNIKKEKKLIPNPKYKGVWHPHAIRNPKYKDPLIKERIKEIKLNQNVDILKQNNEKGDGKQGQQLDNKRELSNNENTDKMNTSIKMKVNPYYYRIIENEEDEQLISNQDSKKLSNMNMKNKDGINNTNLSLSNNTQIDLSQFPSYSLFNNIRVTGIGFELLVSTPQLHISHIYIGNDDIIDKKKLKDSEGKKTQRTEKDENNEQFSSNNRGINNDDNNNENNSNSKSNETSKQYINRTLIPPQPIITQQKNKKSFPLSSYKIQRHDSRHLPLRMSSPRQNQPDFEFSQEYTNMMRPLTVNAQTLAQFIWYPRFLKEMVIKEQEIDDQDPAVKNERKAQRVALFIEWFFGPESSLGEGIAQFLITIIVDIGTDHPKLQWALYIVGTILILTPFAILAQLLTMFVKWIQKYRKRKKEESEMHKRFMEKYNKQKEQERIEREKKQKEEEDKKKKKFQEQKERMKEKNKKEDETVKDYLEEGIEIEDDGAGLKLDDMEDISNYTEEEANAAEARLRKTLLDLKEKRRLFEDQEKQQEKENGEIIDEEEEEEDDQEDDDEEEYDVEEEDEEEYEWEGEDDEEQEGEEEQEEKEKENTENGELSKVD